MNYKKAFNIVLIIDFLLLILLGTMSYRFLIGQIQKSKQLEPEILAQYEISLETEKFFQLLNQLRKSSRP